MTVKTFTRSFAGGEVAELLFGRLDLAKNQTGLAQCLNFLVTPQGPIENRAGFGYVNRTKTFDGEAVLIPFSYNAEQSYVLEFGANYIRFHTQGATLLETSKPVLSITLASPGVFEATAHGYGVNDWVYLSGMGAMVDLDARYGVVTSAPSADTFTLADMYGSLINTTTMPGYTGGSVARVYEISAPYLADELFDLHFVQSADVLTITHPNHAPRELRRLSAVNWQLSTISFLPTISAPGIAAITPTGVGATLYNYTATSVAGNGEESLQSIVSTIGNDLTLAGNSNAVALSGVTGAVRYNVYREKNGLFGFIGQTDIVSGQFIDDNIEPDTSKTPPLATAPFASDYPSAVSYYEQRRAFAGSTALPQTVWMTRAGTESNMSYSIPTQDDDAITARIVAREANMIRHLVPLDDLLALTSGGVWKISAAGADVITPSSFSAKPHGYVGASNVQPVVTSDSVLYAPDRGAHIREITYKWEKQRYTADDVAVLAPHLFDFKNIVQLSYSKTPYQVLWAVRDDGVLLGMTHQPEHEVKAWHRHDTQGAFKSVCAIAEGDEDGVYVIVRRQVNTVWVRYIERLHTRQIPAIEDAFFVDAGITYDGSPATTFYGLHHLEGMEVAILADGGAEPVQTVENGRITLPTAASVVHVGLAYSSDAKSMPLASESLEAFGQGVPKNVTDVALRVYQSSNIEAGPSFDDLRTFPQDPPDYGEPPSALSELVRFKMAPQWQRDGAVCIRQAEPLPLTLLSMTLEVSTGG